MRDLRDKFSEVNAEIFGISADNVVSHQKFIDKYNLNFSLLVDSEKTMSEAYDSKKLLGVARHSFLINPEGQIAKIYTEIKDKDAHALEVLEEIKAQTQ
jgi:peroxiredoxin Q/BCP